MAIKSKWLERVESPVTFYAYTDGINGKRLASKTKIILFADQFQDYRGHMVFNPATQRTAIFNGGIYQTDIKEDIDFLDNYNSNKKTSKITVSREFMPSDGQKVITKVEKVKVIPIEFAKTLQPDQLISLMKDTYSYTAQAKNVVELIEEGKKQGFFE